MELANCKLTKMERERKSEKRVEAKTRKERKRNEHANKIIITIAMETASGPLHIILFYLFI